MIKSFPPIIYFSKELLKKVGKKPNRGTTTCFHAANSVNSISIAYRISIRILDLWRELRKVLICIGSSEEGRGNRRQEVRNRVASLFRYVSRRLIMGGREMHPYFYPYQTTAGEDDSSSPKRYFRRTPSKEQLSPRYVIPVIHYRFVIGLGSPMRGNTCN